MHLRPGWMRTSIERGQTSAALANRWHRGCGQYGESEIVAPAHDGRSVNQAVGDVPRYGVRTLILSEVAGKCRPYLRELDVVHPLEISRTKSKIVGHDRVTSQGTRRRSHQCRPCRRRLQLVWGCSVSMNKIDRAVTFLQLSLSFGSAGGHRSIPKNQAGTARGYSMVDLRSEAEPASGANLRAANLYAVDHRGPNHDAAMRIGGEVPRWRAPSSARQQRPCCSAGRRHLGSLRRSW